MRAHARTHAQTHTHTHTHTPTHSHTQDEEDNVFVESLIELVAKSEVLERSLREEVKRHTAEQQQLHAYSHQKVQDRIAAQDRAIKELRARVEAAEKGTSVVLRNLEQIQTQTETATSALLADHATSNAQVHVRETLDAVRTLAVRAYAALDHENVGVPP